jgi:hypothetical protein
MLGLDNATLEPRNRAERRAAESHCPPSGFTIQGAVQYSGLTRSRIYEAIAANSIVARKAGRQTIVDGDSLRAYLANLPRADIRLGRKAA